MERSLATQLRTHIDSGRFVQAPGVFDCVSARVVDRLGFDAMYVTGHGLANSTIGKTDVGLLSYGEMADRVRHMTASVSTPAIVDVDTGFGGPLNVQRMIIDMEAMGVAAVQMEDQTWPKKCGHMANKQLIPAPEMVQKLRAAADVRKGDLVIIARTDALAVEGFDGAIQRCHAYFESGADVVFIDALGGADECRRAAEQLEAPMLANMVEGSRTAYLDAGALEELGFAIGIWPLTLLLSAVTAMQRAATDLASSGRLTRERMGDTMRFNEFLEFWDYSAIQALEERYAPTAAAT